MFGNDSTLDYYPKFGFRQAKEYEYSLIIKTENSVIDTMDKYILEKVDLSDNKSSEILYKTIETYDKKISKPNPNDDFSMCNNLGLYQFWLSGTYAKNIYYIPEIKSYVIASIEDEILIIHQIISHVCIDFRKLAASFQDNISKIKFDFTPIEKERYEVSIHKVEDCTLFVLGDDLYNLENKKLIFPALSHA